MSEDKDLLDRIGKISGQINIHRTHPYSAQTPPFDPPAAVKTSRGAATPRASVNAAWRPQRAAPYPVGRARGGRIAAASHRHRSLVLNNKTVQSSDSVNENDTTGQKEAYVTKHDRHIQLINSSIYDRETQQRHKAIEETRKQKLIAKDRLEKQKIQQHIRVHVPRAASGIYQITINGIQFAVINDGTKLERIKGPFDSSRPTPKQADVGGVKFFRTSNGNLLRNGIVKAKKDSRNFKKISEPCARFTSTGRLSFFPLNLAINPKTFGIEMLGTDFLSIYSLGQCLKGPLCPFVHDPDKIAMCKDFLRNGTCQPLVDRCHLSHDPSPERVPACLHFLRGNCTNPSCRYAHVQVNPSAPVCKAFATMGYCSQGADCSERHVHECPDYTDTGSCRNQKCRLPHVDRADQMKKYAADNTGRTAPSTEDDDSDLVSEEDDDSDGEDVDSDDLEEMMGRTEASHALSQQQDFVHL